MRFFAIIFCFIPSVAFSTPSFIDDETFKGVEAMVIDGNDWKRRVMEFGDKTEKLKREYAALKNHPDDKNRRADLARKIKQMNAEADFLDGRMQNLFSKLGLYIPKTIGAYVRAGEICHVENMALSSDFEELNLLFEELDHINNLSLPDMNVGYGAGYDMVTISGVPDNECAELASQSKILQGLLANYVLILRGQIDQAKEDMPRREK